MDRFLYQLLMCENLASKNLSAEGHKSAPKTHPPIICLEVAAPPKHNHDPHSTQPPTNEIYMFNMISSMHSLSLYAKPTIFEIMVVWLAFLRAFLMGGRRSCPKKGRLSEQNQ